MKSLRKRISIVLAVSAMGTLFPGMSIAETSQTPQSGTATLTIGGGCFWCLEALFETLDGVVSVKSGYAGGSVPNPSYKAVGTGRTGHAEVIQIEYNPQETTITKLLDFFWEAHDPTTLNRQGADVGTQYRSIILYTDADQKAAAEASFKAAEQLFSKPITTEIKELDTFYPAEAYHQDYFKNNPNAPYCQYVIAPKLRKLES